jgi:hypothetical protein
VRTGRPQLADAAGQRDPRVDFDATALLIAVAVLGVLPVGPSVGAAAAVLILGAQGVAGVSAAGIMLTATGAAGALALPRGPMPTAAASG